MGLNIRSRLQFAFGSLAIFPLLLLALILAGQNFLVQREQTLALQREIVERAAVQIKSFITELEDELKITAQISDFNTMDRHEQYAVLSKLAFYKKRFAEVALVDSKGKEQVYVSLLEFVESARVKDWTQAKEFLFPVKTDTTYYGPVTFGENGEPFMNISHPIGELTGGIAHELNQPLMYIRSNAQLETMEGPEHLNPQSAYETLKMVEEGTDRMMNIINHLRDFARHTDSHMETVRVHEVLDNSFILFHEQFRLRLISVEKKYAECLPEISGNPNQLEQVFINLLSNARDALSEREDGVITITTECQGREDGSSTLVIRFSDNGPGIPETILDKIFDPFFSTKETEAGTGLGLSISYGIIKDHGGEISVSSSEGEGTTFEIILPILQDE